MANNYYGHWSGRKVKMGDKVLLARSAALAPKFLGSVMTHEPPGEVIGETITGDTKISWRLRLCYTFKALEAWGLSDYSGVSRIHSTEMQDWILMIEWNAVPTVLRMTISIRFWQMTVLDTVEVSINKERFPIKRLQPFFFSNIISTKPGCIRLSVFLPGRPPAAALSAVAFCSLMATITLNGPPLFLSTVKGVFLFQENHIWMYTKPFVHRALHPWYPSSHRPFNTVDSGDQTGFGLHFILSC